MIKYERERQVYLGRNLRDLANIPKVIVDFTLYFPKFSKFFCWMIPGGITLVRLKDPWFYYHNFIIHQIWGVVATWLIIKYLVKEKPGWK